MKDKMKTTLLYLLKMIILYAIGGIVYMLVEMLWRGYTHWSMGIVGGICFVLMGQINEFLSFDMYIEIQAIISAGIITIIEFIAGVILNLILKWDIWDYSMMPFNIMGQVCLLFTFLWMLLSIIGIYLDDFIRWVFFKEEKPHYKSWLVERK